MADNEELLLNVVIPFQENMIKIMNLVKQGMPLTDTENQKWILFLNLIKTFNFIQKHPNNQLSDIVGSSDNILNPTMISSPHINNPLSEPKDNKNDDDFDIISNKNDVIDTDNESIEKEIEFKKEDYIPVWTEEEQLTNKKLFDDISRQSLNAFCRAKKNDWVSIFYDDVDIELNLVDDFSQDETKNDTEDKIEVDDDDKSQYLKSSIVNHIDTEYICM